MRRLSVRAQLTLWFAACLAAGLAAFGVGLYLVFGGYLLSEVDRALEEEVQEVVREVRRAPSGEIRDRLVENFGNHQFYVIQVTDPAGRLAFISPSADTSLLPRTSEGSAAPWSAGVVGRPPHRVIVRDAERPEGRYSVAVGDSLASYRRVLGRFVTALAVLGPVAAAGALLGGYWLSRRALRPVDRLTRAALAISATDLHRRVPEDRTRDEVGRLARAFNTMLGRLEASFEETRRFTADAAHELRTPLSVLRTSADVALRADGSVADYRRVLAGHVEEIDRLSRLADQLLFLCREDAGLQKEHAEEVSLDLLLEELCEAMQPAASARSVELVSDELAACTVEAPPDRVRRLFLNLLDNALRYTPAGGRVEVRLAAEGGEAAVTVADDGIGIAAEHLPHLFERFYRGEASRSRVTGGCGLGLAICRSIVASLGGGISITSAVGRGTTVGVRIPVQARVPAGGSASRCWP